MSAPQAKKFGLIVKQKEEPKKVAPVRVKSVFGDDDDDDDDMPATATNTASASVIRIQKAAEREHQKAEAEDPTIFDYDGNYDEIQAIKNEKKEEARKADKNKESKYAEAIIKAHQRRQLEQFSREERQQIKEREKEAGEFDDKEVFVTGAYRKQQEEVKKYREQEAEEAAFNDMTSVQKQKMWEMGMGRTLLNDLARDPTAIRQRKAEASKKSLRKREDDEEEEQEDQKDSKTEDVKKKSIYDTDSEEEEKEKKEVLKPKKNFEGELKAGLNVVTKKATTRAERVQRNFTPTPPSSDDEREKPAPRAVGDHRSSRRSSSPGRRSREAVGRRSRSKSVERKEEKEVEKKQKVSLKDKLKPKKIDKQARLDGLKAILAQRNTEQDIEEARQRYFERREQGIVVPPL